MQADQLTELLTAFLTFVAALFGLSQYFRFRSRRDWKTEVGHAFGAVVSGLGSANEIERLASAALIRRFIDPKSEYAASGGPYAQDAMRVMAAVLRSEPSGPVQKLLGDGLGSAKSLRNVDLQRVNLRGCFLGVQSPQRGHDFEGADLYRADASGASFRRANLRGSKFREARLVGTVFAGADCSRADFGGADLLGARFDEAVLEGASFAGAVNVPRQITELLDGNGLLRNGGQPIASNGAADGEKPLRVFISAPYTVGDGERFFIDRVCHVLGTFDVETVRLLREHYGPHAPLAEVAAEIGRCDGLLIVGVPQIAIERGTSKPDTTEADVLVGCDLATPWNQIEAGAAAAFGVPMLVLKSSVTGGVFDLPSMSPALEIVDVGTPSSLQTLPQTIETWVRSSVQDHHRLNR